VRADRIDILVDLKRATRGQSAPGFHPEAAPVQATYSDYPGTTGISAIDYRLSDERADPPGGGGPA